MHRTSSAPVKNNKNNTRGKRAASEPPANLDADQPRRSVTACKRGAEDFDPSSPIDQLPLRSKSSVPPVCKGPGPSPGFFESLPEPPPDTDMPSRSVSGYPGRMSTSGWEDSDDDAVDDTADEVVPGTPPARMPTNP